MLSWLCKEKKVVGLVEKPSLLLLLPPNLSSAAAASPPPAAVAHRGLKILVSMGPVGVSSMTVSSWMIILIDKNNLPTA